MRPTVIFNYKWILEQTHLSLCVWPLPPTTLKTRYEWNFYHFSISDTGAPFLICNRSCSWYSFRADSPLITLDLYLTLSNCWWVLRPPPFSSVLCLWVCLWEHFYRALSVLSSMLLALSFSIISTRLAALLLWTSREDSAPPHFLSLYRLHDPCILLACKCQLGLIGRKSIGQECKCTVLYYTPTLSALACGVQLVNRIEKYLYQTRGLVELPSNSNWTRNPPPPPHTS